MPTSIKILHLSDLHLEHSERLNQSIVVNALIKDIASTVKADGPFDFVFFTGDLIAKGNYSGDNTASAIDYFIVPLLAAAQCRQDRFFIVPGNHDVNLKSQSHILAGALQQLSDSDSITNYLAEVTAGPSMSTGLEGFNKLLEIMPGPTPVLTNPYYRAYIVPIDNLKIGVCAINSAWRATGAKSDGDYGKLVVGRKQIDELINAVRGCDVVIGLIHHPLSWLMPKDAQDLHRQLLLNIDAIFHGHNHSSDSQLMTGTSDAYFISNAGCLYQSRDYYNGYLVHTLTLTKKNGTHAQESILKSDSALISLHALVPWAKRISSEKKMINRICQNYLPLNI